MQLSNCSMPWDRRRHMSRLHDIDEGSTRAPESVIECGSAVLPGCDDKALLPGVHSALGLTSPRSSLIGADVEDMFGAERSQGAATVFAASAWRRPVDRARTGACFAFGFFVGSLLLSAFAVGRYHTTHTPVSSSTGMRTNLSPSLTPPPPPSPPLPHQPPSVPQPPAAPAVALPVLGASMSSTLSNADFPGHDFSAGTQKWIRTAFDGYLSNSRIVTYSMEGTEPSPGASHACRADKCIDGLTDNRQGWNFCMTPTNQQDPWLTLRVPPGSTIRRAVIYGRADCCQRHLSPFEVWVGRGAAVRSRCGGNGPSGLHAVPASVGPFDVACGGLTGASLLYLSSPYILSSGLE